METVMIDCAEKFTRMADLAAAADEYRYNGLIDPTFQLNMARCTVTPDCKKGQECAKGIIGPISKVEG